MRISQYSLAFVLLLHTLYVAVKSDDKNCHSFVSALAFTTTPTVMRPHRHVINRSPAMNAAMSFSGVPSGRSGARGRVMLAQYTGEGHEDDNFDDQKQSPEPVYYDDFDFSPGANSNVDASKDMNEKSSDSVAENQPETLSNLFQNSRDEEDDRNSRIIQNWENGNWKCRGFSLDKFNPVPLPPDTVDDGSTETGGIDEPMQQSGGPNILSFNSNSNNNSLDEKRIEISKITFDETALGPGFGTTSETIAVGRTDGTVYIVQLGNEYLTKFQAVPKVSMGGNWDGEGGEYDNDGGAAPSARIEMEMINQEERVGVEMSDMNFNDLPLGGDVNLDSHIPRDVSTPFVIECQFQAHGRDEAISALLFHDDTLFTSAKGEGKGMIKVWDMHGASSSTGTRMVPLHNLDGAHRDEVVVLKTLSSTPSAKDVSDHNLLLSASKDGSFAMWDMKGDLVYRCELLDDDGNPTAITCADVDTSGEEHIIYLGLSSGE
jgi:WD40 repeat protein